MLASRSRAIRTRSVSLVCRARPTCGRGCNFSNVSLSLRLPAKSLGVNSCLVASAADPPTRRTRPRSCSSGATLAREQSGKRMSDLTQPTYARNRPRMRTRATAGSRMRRPSTRRSTGQCARHAGSNQPDSGKCARATCNKAFGPFHASDVPPPPPPPPPPVRAQQPYCEPFWCSAHQPSCTSIEEHLRRLTWCAWCGLAPPLVGALSVDRSDGAWYCQGCWDAWETASEL